MPSDEFYADAINRQKAIETNIPVLSGLLFAFLGGFFVSVAVADIAFLKAKPNVHPQVINDNWKFEIPVERRICVMVACFLAAGCFYKSIVDCIWSQMSNFKDSAFTFPTEVRADARKTQEEFWEKRRKHYAQIALLAFNMGSILLIVPFTFVLPDNAIILGWLVVLLAVIAVAWTYRRKRG